jgi:hypothetical protein
LLNLALESFYLSSDVLSQRDKWALRELRRLAVFAFLLLGLQTGLVYLSPKWYGVVWGIVIGWFFGIILTQAVGWLLYPMARFGALKESLNHFIGSVLLSTSGILVLSLFGLGFAFGVRWYTPEIFALVGCLWSGIILAHLLRRSGLSPLYSTLLSIIFSVVLTVSWLWLSRSSLVSADRVWAKAEVVWKALKEKD